MTILIIKLKNGGDMIDILEELWFGNLQPMEYNDIQHNQEYKRALELVNANSARLKNELNPKQADMFERYCESSRELSDIMEMDAFKSGFTIAMSLTINCFK